MTGFGHCNHCRGPLSEGGKCALESRRRSHQIPCGPCIRLNGPGARPPTPSTICGFKLKDGYGARKKMCQKWPSKRCVLIKARQRCEEHCRRNHKTCRRPQP